MEIKNKNSYKLEELIQKKNPDCILVDGLVEAGKTPLAEEIEEELNFFMVDGDDFQRNEFEA